MHIIDDRNLKLIKASIEEGEFGGKYCKDCTGKIYYVVAATMTHEDYYYVGIAKNRTICFLSCIGDLDVVEPDTNDFSVLNYLLKNEPENVAEDVKRYIDTTNDILVTNVCINGKLY